MNKYLANYALLATPSSTNSISVNPTTPLQTISYIKPTQGTIGTCSNFVTGINFIITVSPTENNQITAVTSSFA